MGVTVDLMPNERRLIRATPCGTWHSRFLPPAEYDKMFERAGKAWPTVLYDGRVIVVWMEDNKRQILLMLLFDGAEKALVNQLEVEGERLSQFLQHDIPDVRIEPYPEDVYPRTPFSLGRRG